MQTILKTPLSILSSLLLLVVTSMHIGAVFAQSDVSLFVPKPSREPFYNFTTPYLDIPHVIVAQRKTSFIESEEALKGKKIALEKGFGNVSYFKTHYPKIELLLYKDTITALEAVSRGDADVYAGNRVVALYLIDKFALSNLKIHGRLNKSGSILTIGTRKDYPILRDILQKALNDISKKGLHKITNHWIHESETDQENDDSVIKKIDLSDAEKIWIEEHKIIEIGVDGNWPPIDFIDEDHEFRGITADYLNEIGRTLGIGFIPRKSDTFKEMLNKVMSGELKVGATISKNKQRSKSLLFSTPFFHVQSVIIARKGSQNILGIQSLYGKTVAIENGFVLMRKLQEEHPEIRLLPTKSTLEALRAVSFSKADAYVGNQAVAAWLIQQDQLTNLLPVNDTGFGRHSENFVVSKAAPDWAPLIGILDKALENISAKRKFEIESHWLGQINNKKSDALILNLTSKEKAWLKRHKNLKVGVMDSWPPISHLNEVTGKVEGIDVDIIKEINKHLEYPLNVIPASWDSIYQQAKEKKLDVILGITPKEFRKEFFSFTKPYLSVPHVIVAQANNNTFYFNEQDLQHKIIALEKSFVNVEYFKKNYPEVIIQTYDNTLDALEAVSRGDADAYAGSRIVVLYLIEKHLFTNLKIQGKLAKKATANAIGVRKDYSILRDILQKILDSIGQDSLKDIKNRWLRQTDIPKSQYPVLDLTQQERTWLKQHTEITLGVDAAWKPLEFIDNQGQYQGVAAEFMAYFSQQLGIKFKAPEKMAWSQTMQKLENKELDLAPLITLTDKRSEFLSFTKPYLDFPAVIFNRKGTILLNGLSDLNGKKVGIVKGYSISEFVDRDHPNIQQVFMSSTQQGLEALSTGKIDAYIDMLAVGGYQMVNAGLSNLQVAASMPYRNGNRFRIGVRNDWPELVSILNKAISVLPEEKKSAILKKWLVVEFQQKTNYTLLFWVVGIALLIFIVLSLRAREMHKINKQLHDANEAVEKSNQFKSQFLANMSHEIRTPMNAIVGIGHLLSCTQLNNKQIDYINTLQKSAQSLLGLIDDILDFSKIESGHLNIEVIEFNLDKLLHDLSDITTHKLTDKKLEFIYQLSSDVPLHLKGDPFRINQILINLVSNAIKFTEQGHVILNIQTIKHEDDKVWLKFEVSDTGIGINPEKVQGLFRPFEQEDNSTTRKYGGTGLGLSISHQLAELMGGTIGASSIKGKGSQFYFSLPFEIIPSKQKIINMPEPNLQGLRVLLVDDNPQALNILSEMMESMSFMVSTALSGESCLQQLMNSAENIEIILLDWRMPGMSGEETINEIHRLLPKNKIPLIIMMTAYGRDAIEHKIDQLSLDGFLVKPITPSLLFDAIMQAKDNKQNLTTGNYQKTMQTRFVAEALTGQILLAEDNLVNQQVAKEILQQMGLDVWICHNGVEVLDLLKKRHPDLILMDIQMPKMDGYEATRLIKNNPETKHIPVIAMTANAMAEDIEKSVQAGMQAHISKPVDPKKLFQELSLYLNKSSLPIAHKKDSAVITLNKWPDNIPGLNIKQGIKQVGGNESLYQKLLKDFLKNHGDVGTMVSNNIKEGDLIKAEREIHTIKGVAGNIGANKMQKIASEIGHQLHIKAEISDDLLNLLSEACYELCGNLRDLIDKTEKKSLNATHLENDTDFEHSLDAFLHALNANDSQSEQLLQHISASLKSRIGVNNIQTLHSLIDDFEYEDAAEFLLKRLKES